MNVNLAFNNIHFNLHSSFCNNVIILYALNWPKDFALKERIVHALVLNMRSREEDSVVLLCLFHDRTLFVSYITLPVMLILFHFTLESLTEPCIVPTHTHKQSLSTQVLNMSDL